MEKFVCQDVKIESSRVKVKCFQLLETLQPLSLVPPTSPGGSSSRELSQLDKTVSVLLLLSTFSQVFTYFMAHSNRRHGRTSQRTRSPAQFLVGCLPTKLGPQIKPNLKRCLFVIQVAAWSTRCPFMFVCIFSSTSLLLWVLPSASLLTDSQPAAFLSHLIAPVVTIETHLTCSRNVALPHLAHLNVGKCSHYVRFLFYRQSFPTYWYSHCKNGR